MKKAEIISNKVLEVCNRLPEQILFKVADYVWMLTEAVEWSRGWECYYITEDFLSLKKKKIYKLLYPIVYDVVYELNFDDLKNN